MKIKKSQVKLNFCNVLINIFLLMTIACSAYLFSHLTNIYTTALEQSEDLQRVEMAIELSDTRNEIVYDVHYDNKITSDKNSLISWFKRAGTFNRKYENFFVYHLQTQEFIWSGKNKDILSSKFTDTTGNILSFDNVVSTMIERPEYPYFINHNGLWYLIEWTYTPNNKYDFNGKYYNADNLNENDGLVIFNIRSIEEMVSSLNSLETFINFTKIVIIGLNLLLLITGFFILIKLSSNQYEDIQVGKN